MELWATATGRAGKFCSTIQGNLLDKDHAYMQEYGIQMDI
jgi:hypothetical protein